MENRWDVSKMTRIIGCSRGITGTIRVLIRLNTAFTCAFSQVLCMLECNIRKIVIGTWLYGFNAVTCRTECFCGNDEPPMAARLADSSCNMKCPADAHMACGGYYTINIYQTGIASK